MSDFDFQATPSTTLQSQSLRLAASAARIGFWSWSPPDEFQWDRSFYEIAGLDPERHRPCPETLLQFTHPEDRHLIVDGSRAITNGGDLSPRDEFRFIGPDGRMRWFEIHRKRVPDSAEIVGLVQDITERKGATEALKASEARLDLATSAAKIGIWDWDLVSDRFVFCQRARIIYGFGPTEEVTLKALRAAIHPDDRDYTAALLARALDPHIRSREPYHYRIRRPNGDIRRVVAHGAVVFSPAGKPGRYVGTMQDVTDQWNLERRTAESEARLRLAVEAGRMAVWEVETATGQITRSAELNRLLGFGEDESPTLEDLRSRYYPGERERLSEAARAAMEKNERFFESEFRVVHPNGDVRWLLIRAEIDFDPGAPPRRIVGVLMDITERKRAEDNIRLLMREVNHRSKNMLAVVQSVANQTAWRSKPAEFSERFGERLQGLAASHDLLVRNAWRGVGLTELLISQLSHFGDLIGKRIVFSGPDLKVNAAAAQSLGMALHELATNAGKYGSLSAKAGRLTIVWSVSGEAEEARFRLRWKEEGGPAPAPPQKSGFGTLLLTAVTEQALSADVVLSYEPDGLSWTLDAPFGKMSDGEADLD
jgi:PAS domain S-box-containing protein